MHADNTRTINGGFVHPKSGAMGLIPSEAPGWRTCGAAEQQDHESQKTIIPKGVEAAYFMGRATVYYFSRARLLPGEHRRDHPGNQWNYARRRGKHRGREFSEVGARQASFEIDLDRNMVETVFRPFTRTSGERMGPSLCLF